MQCPKCKSASKVFDTRKKVKLNYVWRNRKCKRASCGHNFSTYEILRPEDARTNAKSFKVNL